MKLRELDAFGRTQLGLIPQWTAESLGLSQQGWYRALNSGRLIEVHPGVARIPGAPVTRHQRILAAVLGTRSAGDRLAPICRVAVGRRPAGWRSHRRDRRPEEWPHRRTGERGAAPSRDLVDLRAVQLGAVPTTPPLRMLVDLGAVDPRSVYSALQDMVIARITPIAAVIAALERHAQRGRAGVGPLRRALDRYPLGAAAADSRLEIRMAELIRRFGLPPVGFHAVIAGWEVDFLVTGTKVILECDGRQHVLDPAQVARDARRDDEPQARW